MHRENEWKNLVCIMYSWCLQQVLHELENNSSPQDQRWVWRAKPEFAPEILAVRMCFCHIRTLTWGEHSQLHVMFSADKFSAPKDLSSFNIFALWILSNIFLSPSIFLGTCCRNQLYADKYYLVQRTSVGFFISLTSARSCFRISHLLREMAGVQGTHFCFKSTFFFRTFSGEH